MGLFDSQDGYLSDDAGKAYRAVKNTSDQKILVKAAKQAKHGYVRNLAIQKLDSNTSQGLLLKIAKHDKEAEARVYAAIKLSNKEQQQSILRELVMSENALVRLEAAKNLTDITLAQSIFTELAKNSDYSLEAAKLLNNRIQAQHFIAEIALNAKYNDERKNATYLLSDKNVLMKIANSDKYGEVQLAAADRLACIGANDESQGIYISIAMNNDELTKFRLKAAEKIDDIKKAKLAFASLLRVTKGQKRDVGGGYITVDTEDYEKVKYWLEEHR